MGPTWAPLLLQFMRHRHVVTAAKNRTPASQGTAVQRLRHAPLLFQGVGCLPSFPLGLTAYVARLQCNTAAVAFMTRLETTDKLNTLFHDSSSALVAPNFLLLCLRCKQRLSCLKSQHKFNVLCSACGSTPLIFCEISIPLTRAYLELFCKWHYIALI